MKDVHCYETACFWVLDRQFFLATVHVPGKWEEKPGTHEKPCASYLRYRPDTGDISYSERCPEICGGCSYHYGVNVKYWDAFIPTRFCAPALNRPKSLA
jgi:hypothetical protein